MKNFKKYLLCILFISVLFNFSTVAKAQYYICGNVTYSDNGSPLVNDKVYILYYNYDLCTTIYFDSAAPDQSGKYRIQTLYNDSVIVCVGHQEILPCEDHVQTFYPSAIDWTKAQKIYPPDNPTNINISVDRIIPQSGSSCISGTITTLDSNNHVFPLSALL